MRQIKEDLYYIGVNDYSCKLFEHHYPLSNGVTYNAYLIKDEKTMVISTTDQNYCEEWLEATKKALEGKNPDYLLILHMEPDHSAAIERFMEEYPDTTLVASKGALNMMKNYFGTDYAGHNLAIKEGDTLSLGKHTLCFVAAPMVHWPEVMMAYDASDKVLFSADAFGRFGAPLNPQFDAASKEYEAEEWLKEARRYYIGIVGKQGPAVQGVLQKAAGLEINTICPLHGPVLTKDLERYLEVYQKWSAYTPESDGITICYSSVYGHTKEAVLYLIEILKEKGETADIKVFDLVEDDITEAVAECFAGSKVVLATTTYNNDIFPAMRTFIDHLKYSAFQKRKVALIENGSWGPKAASVMKSMLQECPEIEYLTNQVTIRSALNDAVKQQLKVLAEELLS